MVRPSRATRLTVGAWLLGLVILVACSWARWGLTHSLKIDENYPGEPAGSALLVAMVVGWTLAIVGWVRLLNRPLARPRLLAYAGLFVMAFMLPLLSNDIYFLFADSSLAAHGKDIYLSAQARPSSEWFSFLGERWRDTPCIYGPLAMIGSMASMLGHGNPLLARLFMRLAWFVPLILVMELSFRRLKDRPFFHAMLWLNPLFMVEGPGQLHVDLLGVVAITAGILFQQRGRRVSGALTWALATLSKFSFVLTAPWFILTTLHSWPQRIRNGLVMTAALITVGTAMYVPFWHGPETLLAPLRTLSAMNPGGAVVDVMGELGSQARGIGFDPTAPVREVLRQERETRATVWAIASALMLLVAIAAIFPTVRFVLRKPDDPDRIALGTGAFIIAVVTLASPRFQSWYLMAALPFFALSCPPAWRRWWVWAVSLSVSQGFALALPRSAFLFAPTVAISTGFTALIFVLSFRTRYWKLAGEREDEVADVVEGPVAGIASAA